MRRREVVHALIGATVFGILPLPARAQQMRRIGMMMANYAQSDVEGQASSAAFEGALQGLGWTVGKNIQLDYRWDAADMARVKASAMELIRSAPDAIVVAANPATAVLHSLTNDIPIVFTRVADPVGSGYVRSLARPGGNITGFQASDATLGSKWVGVLKEAVPALQRVAVLYGSNSGGNIAFLHAAESAARASGIELKPVDIFRAEDWEQQVAAFGGEPNGSLLVVAHPFTNAHRKTIIGVTVRLRLPAIYTYRFFANEGGLISYGPDEIEQWHGAATYVSRILKGEKPGDLPVQAPTKYELVLNLKTAKIMGIDFPQGLLARADGVIE